jgi:DNA polymerase-3 subunit gamma/tau
MPQALYQKYRPENFDEVRGQDHITSVLSGAVESGDIAHAYLFSGRRGIGKTSIARILAKEIGVTDRDIYEIDAASNRGIDDIRDLKEAVTSLPYESDHKFYIIDEVHMLTKPAFNALLKTLEEPPEYVIFVLATTEPDKLPETIISRCETHEFRQPSSDQLAEAVADVASKEDRELDSAAAAVIARAADGSFRDAFGLLDKCLRATKGAVSADLAEEITGLPPHQLVSDIVFSGIAASDPAPALEALEQANDNNLDPGQLFDRVIQIVRAVLLIRLAPKLAEEIKAEISSDLFAKIDEEADNNESRITTKTLHTLLSHRNQLASDTLGNLPLELAVMKLTDND